MSFEQDRIDARIFCVLEKGIKEKPSPEFGRTRRSAKQGTAAKRQGEALPARAQIKYPSSKLITHCSKPKPYGSKLS